MQARGVSKSLTDSVLAIRQSSFSVFPYIFNGTGDTSCPAELTDRKYESLSNWSIYRDSQGEYYVPDNVKRQYRSEFKKVLGHIVANHFRKAPLYSRMYDEIFHNLFRTVKHEDIKGYLDSNPTIAEHLFVKTHAYQEVKTQRAYILTGRKGTGKTTLTENLARMHKNVYKEHFPIKLDDFELETIVAMLSIPQISSDTEFIIRRERAFRMAWELFIHVHCMEIVVYEWRTRGLKPNQEKAVPHVDEFIKRTFVHDVSKSQLKKSSVYLWALNKVIDHINISIDQSRTEDQAKFFYDLDDRTSGDKVIEGIFSREVLFPFSNILKECTKRFLISLDGFDRNFDDFRRNAKLKGKEEEDIRHIVSLEMDWVRSLLYLCRVIKRDRDKWSLYPLIDFCVTVPKDRCLEIMHSERDSIAYFGRICEIKWSGIELAIMLRKRLEILFDYNTDKERDPIDRLQDVVSVGLEKLPSEGSTKIGNRVFQLPLFLDILRHTFWRPRDILMYYTSVIAAYQYLVKHNVEVEAEIINKMISDTTYDVIDKEFIGEFQSSLRNIDKVVRSFKGCKQVLSCKELEDILSQLEFEFSDTLQKNRDTKSKASFMFQIGFLGLRCSQSTRDRFRLSLDNVFYFNDSGKLEKMIEDDTWKECEIVIHPIFCEYLDLDTRGVDLTLKYSWQYLRKQEGLDHASFFL